MKIKFITIPEIIIALVLIFFIFSSFLSTFAAKLNVPDNLIGRRTLYLVPQASAPTCAPTCEGKLYFDDSDSVVKYCDGATWQALGAGGGAAGGDKYIATRIVAARNSLNTTCVGANCTNPRADYTCDGTSDQVEIQNAINALGTTAGAVYLLEGTYNMTGQINFDNTAPIDSNKTLIGTGKGTVLKLAYGNGIYAKSVNRILISQLMIYGNNAGAKGIYFESVTNSKIDKVWIENMKGDGIYLYSSSNNNTISNNHIKSNSGSGIYILPTTSSNTTIYANNVQLNSYGIYLGGSNHLVSANNVQLNSYGIYFFGSDNTISANNIQRNTYGIYAESSTGNTITGNNIQGMSFGFNGVYFSSSGNNTITGNNIQGHLAEGIYFYNSPNNIIIGNEILENGVSGISFDGTLSDNNLISSNRIYDSSGSGYGIDIRANSDKTYVVGNLINGFAEPIYDVGANTTYIQKEKITIARQAAVAPTAGSALNVTTNPKSYLPLAPASAVTLNTATSIVNGRAIGDILILEGTNDNNTVTINNNTNVRLDAATKRVLGLDDTLKLLWNGVDWIEISNATN